MSDQLYALPGFMPPTKPKTEDRVTTPWSQPINIEVYREDELLPESPTQWYIQLQGWGPYLLKQVGAESIHPEIENGERVYRLRLPARTLPAGSHTIEVLIGSTNRISTEINLHIPETLESKTNPAELRGVTQHDVVTTSGSLYLFASASGTYYKLI